MDSLERVIQGNSHENSLLKRSAPRNRHEPEQPTDRWAVERYEISITPLRLDLTDKAELESLRNP
jgi:broad specificity polyphosphatase/5'/3'-nucleotidase SurE